MFQAMEIAAEGQVVIGKIDSIQLRLPLQKPRKSDAPRLDTGSAAWEKLLVHNAQAMLLHDGFEAFQSLFGAQIDTDIRADIADAPIVAGQEMLSALAARHSMRRAHNRIDSLPIYIQKLNHRNTASLEHGPGTVSMFKARNQYAGGTPAQDGFDERFLPGWIIVGDTDDRLETCVFQDLVRTGKDFRNHRVANGRNDNSNQLRCHRCKRAGDTVGHIIEIGSCFEDFGPRRLRNRAVITQHARDRALTHAGAPRDVRNGHNFPGGRLDLQLLAGSHFTAFGTRA